MSAMLTLTQRDGATARDNTRSPDDIGGREGTRRGRATDRKIWFPKRHVPGTKLVPRHDVSTDNYQNCYKVLSSPRTLYEIEIKEKDTLYSSIRNRLYT